MKQKIRQIVGCFLFLLSLCSLCGMEYKTLTAEIIGLMISIVAFLISASLIIKHYQDGRWI